MSVRTLEAKDGLTVRELKELIKDWPETNASGDDTEVWIGNREGTSNQAKKVWPLNKDSSDSADLLLEM